MYVSSETVDNPAQQEILNADAIRRVSEARRNLTSKVQQKKNSKLYKKIPAKKQMIAMAREDLSLKNRIVEQIEKAEQKHQESLTAFAKGAPSPNDTPSHLFALLAALQQQPNQFSFPNFQQWRYQQAAMSTNNNGESSHGNANDNFIPFSKS